MQVYFGKIRNPAFMKIASKNVGRELNTFKNVSITVKGADGNLTNVTTVFGKNFVGNTFEDVEIYAASVAKLGTNSSSVDVTSATGVTIKNTL